VSAEPFLDPYRSAVPFPPDRPGRADAAEPGGASAPGRAGFLLASTAVLAIAALVRLLRWREVLWGREVVALDNDSLYHLRRSLDVAAGRGLPTFDPQINWPHGGPVPWAPGFDLLGGAVAWLAGPPGSRASALAVAAVPVALGLAVVALAMALAHAAAPRAVRRPAALAAGLLAGLVPQAIYCSRFGQTDHHVVEALLVTALALWTHVGLGGRRRGWRWEAAGALLAASGVLFFTGAPIYVAIAAAPLVVAALAGEPGAPLVGRGAVGLVAGGALAAVASAPLVASHGRAVSFAFPSYLQPVLVALAGIGVALAWAASRAGPLRRRVAALLLLTIGAAAAAALVPGAARQVVEGVRGWLLARDPWIAIIEEFQAVWRLAAGFRRVHYLWGYAGLALPVLAPVAAWAAWREGPGRAAALLFQALALAALGALQIRFGRPATPVLAAAGAIAVAALAARLPLRRALARVLAPALVLVVFACDRAVWAATADAPLDKGDALVAAALDLRDARPDEPSPGVLAPWDMGHQVNVLGRRPVVANGFGSYLDAAGYEEVRRAYSLREPELAAWMRGRRVGHVVAGLMTFEGKVPGPGTGWPLTTRDGAGALDAVYMRGVPLAPAILGGSGVPDAGIRHLEHLLPRFASLQTARELPFVVPVLWTFELVEGARLGGTAAPGERVVLELDLRERMRSHVWRAWTTAGADGRWALTVPLPTGYAQPTLATGPIARLRVGGAEPVPVKIPEAAVRSGAEVPAGLVAR
jgi:asparagine N-glycosylation enzyme membrane subunit Stt3